MFQGSLSPSQAGEVVDLATIKAELVADGYVVKLFKAGFNPTPLNVAADFAAQEATFTGYASKTVGGAGMLWSAVAIDSAGNVVISSPDLFFQATDAVSPNQIGGMWVENTAGAVRRYSVFPVPVSMIAALAFLNLQIFEQAGGPGYITVEN